MATASGRLFPGDGEQLAVLTEAGDCVVLNETDGVVRWRARWPDIADLTIGDLDGDGIDELVLGGLRRLMVVGRSKNEPAAALD